MPTIADSTHAYESWLIAQIGSDFVTADLDIKHEKMKKDAFTFLRATYWRWAETILEICPDLAGAPEILAIGDTHLENFGTWRDAEGRLIWGANDFDEAAVMPYPLDLVRLAASALLARTDGPSASVICTAILEGYAEGLACPSPLVLERDCKWLRKAVMLPEPERAAFWDKVDALVPTAVPQRYEDALRGAMPGSAARMVISPRTAGTGSLGRPRFVASGNWRGGPVLREAKAVVVSAWSLRYAPRSRTIRAGEIAAGRCRAPDPHYQVSDGIVVRRLSPNSRKIEVKDATDKLLSPRMLELMGREIANCHASDPDALLTIQEDLVRRGGDWLRQAAKAAAQSVAQEQVAFV
ncbi:DUF2252 family protein (plasmid) [Bosea vestrisii]|uniref:DUF2252 family protein n=1 Tax=Bosea vestrisii TaxID=151416 RepID=UPI0024E01091|nr:DUF2252 family protein [Bosea vestrisii]WID99655.1 DUF2252 family protein [Bosea vestrisii]